MATTSRMRSLAEIGKAPVRMGKGMLLVSSARSNIMRMTSEVLVPRLSNRAAVRSLRSAGTRTWIKLLVDLLFLIVVVLILLLYDSVIQKSSILYICSVKLWKTSRLGYRSGSGVDIWRGIILRMW